MDWFLYDNGFRHERVKLTKQEIWNCRVTKWSYETELRKMASHFELLTRKVL